MEPSFEVQFVGDRDNLIDLAGLSADSWEEACKEVADLDVPDGTVKIEILISEDDADEDE